MKSKFIPRTLFMITANCKISCNLDLTSFYFVMTLLELKHYKIVGKIAL